MSKALAARWTGGTLYIEDKPQDPVVVQYQGGQALSDSVGVALISKATILYVPKTSPDLDATLAQLIDELSRLTEALTAIADGFTQTATALASINGMGMFPGVVAPIAAIGLDVTAIGTKSSALTAIKTNLTTLKGALK